MEKAKRVIIFQSIKRPSETYGFGGPLQILIRITCRRRGSGTIGGHEVSGNRYAATVCRSAAFGGGSEQYKRETPKPDGFGVLRKSHSG